MHNPIHFQMSLATKHCTAINFFFYGGFWWCEKNLIFTPNLSLPSQISLTCLALLKVSHATLLTRFKELDLGTLALQ